MTSPPSPRHASESDSSHPVLPPVVVMGVSGSGKSTVGRALAEAWGVRFVDGDELHPASNREKMASGIPLDDDDRAPWLDTIAQLLAQEEDAGRPIIVACSALKRKYRDLLGAHARQATFVLLNGKPDVIASRQAHRVHEYMPNSLLASQLATLEPLEEDERGIVVDLAATPQSIVDEVSAWLGTAGDPQ